MIKVSLPWAKQPIMGMTALPSSFCNTLTLTSTSKMVPEEQHFTGQPWMDMIASPNSFERKCRAEQQTPEGGKETQRERANHHRQKRCVIDRTKYVKDINDQISKTGNKYPGPDSILLSKSRLYEKGVKTTQIGLDNWLSVYNRPRPSLNLSNLYIVSSLKIFGVPSTLSMVRVGQA